MKTKAAGFLTGLVLLVITCAAHAQDNVFFGNLHSHTSHSDGSSTPDKAYKHARDVGLHFLAITEHTTRRPAISRTFTEGQANTLQPNGTIRVRSGPSATGNVSGHNQLDNKLHLEQRERSSRTHRYQHDGRCRAAMMKLSFPFAGQRF